MIAAIAIFPPAYLAMVSTRTNATAGGDGKVDLQAWLATLPPHIEEANLERLLLAGQLAAQCRTAQGQVGDDWAQESDVYLTGLDIVHILAELHLGEDSLVAGMLYRSVCEQRLSLDEVAHQFGEKVASLVSGVQRMSAISDLNIDRDAPVLGQADGQKDNVRKMLIAMVDDVRVALIKLAERTCAIRAVKNDEDRREGVAREVFDVYAPLAHRLGIGQLKWELEDLSFR